MSRIECMLEYFMIIDFTNSITVIFTLLDKQF